MTPEQAEHINEQRALSHIGEYCPKGCNGKLAQVVAVGRDLYNVRLGAPSMTIEYECTTGHRRIYCVELLEVPRTSGGNAPLGSVGGTAATAAAMVAACV